MKDFIRTGALAGALALALGGVSTAAATTVDFEDIASGSCAFLGTSGVTSRGFDFTGNPGDPALFNCNPGVIQSNTSAALIDANSLSIVAMTRAGGGSFTLQSFFAGSRTQDFDPQSVSNSFGLATGIDIVGNLTGGGQVNEQIAFNFLDWDQFTLGPGFQQALDSVVFTALGQGSRVEFLIDDIVVDAARVPAPASVLLFGIGLVGIRLGARRRRRRHAPVA